MWVGVMGAGEGQVSFGRGTRLAGTTSQRWCGRAHSVGGLHGYADSSSFMDELCLVPERLKRNTESMQHCILAVA